MIESFQKKFFKNDCIFCKHVTDHPINHFWIPLNLSCCKTLLICLKTMNDPNLKDFEYYLAYSKKIVIIIINVNLLKIDLLNKAVSMSLWLEMS